MHRTATLNTSQALHLGSTAVVAGSPKIASHVCLHCCAAPAEVFQILQYSYPNQQAAAAGCSTLGAVLATRAQMQSAYYLGANVCSWGYTADLVPAPGTGAYVGFTLRYPTDGCSGDRGVVTMPLAPGGWNSGNAGAVCYGRKPQSNATAGLVVGPFAEQWSMFDTPSEWHPLICTTD